MRARYAKAIRAGILSKRLLYRHWKDEDGYFCVLDLGDRMETLWALELLPADLRRLADRAAMRTAPFAADRYEYDHAAEVAAFNSREGAT